MSSGRKHLRNLAFNWGGISSTMVVMFFLSPYIVGKLDATSYGIWSLLNVLTGYMGIFDLGVRASVGRHVALYLGKKDDKGVDETIRAGFGLFTLTGGLILIAGFLIGWLFPKFFQGVSPEHYTTIRYLLPMMVGNIWLSAVSAIYSSVLTSHDRFDVARGVDLAVLAIRTVTTIYVLHMGWGLLGLVLSVLFASLCGTIINRIFAGICHPGLRSLPFMYSRERFKELFGYGMYAFISSSAVKIIGQSDLVLIGIILSVADVREYSVGAMMIYYSAPFLSAITQTFFPALQRAVGAEAKGEINHLLFRQFRLSMCFGILAYIGIAFYARPFIRLWMLQDGFGEQSVIAAAWVMSILSLSKLPMLYIYPIQSVLSAMGYVRVNAILTLVEAVANLLLSLFFILVLKMGLIGVAFGTLAGRILVPSIFTPIYLFKITGVPIKSFLNLVFLSGAVASCAFSVYCMAVIKLWPINTWIEFVAHVSFAAAVWSILSGIFLLPTDVKKRILTVLSDRRPKSQ